MSLSSSSNSDAVKRRKGHDEQIIARTDSSEMSTQVIEVDAAYLLSRPSNRFFRGLLCQMILL